METVTIPLDTYERMKNRIELLEKEKDEKRPIKYNRGIVHGCLISREYHYQFIDRDEEFEELTKELATVTKQLEEEKKKKRPFIQF